MTTSETTAQRATSEPRVAPSRPTSADAHRGLLTGLSLLIGVLASMATAAGIVTSNGARHRTFISLRGQAITLQGGGLYANDSVSGAAQAIGQDAITLLVAVPLLLAATYLAARGSLRGRLLQSGVLWYFGYTYLLMAFGATYNPLFLVYVALYSASICALFISALSIDVGWLRAQFSPRFARRTIAWSILGFGALLTLLWMGRIVPALLSGTSPAGLESYSTLFVQAGDLGIVVPLAVVTGVLLLLRNPIGYLLAGMLLIKGATLGLALLAMIVSMALAGVPIVLGEGVFFTLVALFCGVGAVHVFRCLPSIPFAPTFDSQPLS